MEKPKKGRASDFTLKVHMDPGDALRRLFATKPTKKKRKPRKKKG